MQPPRREKFIHLFRDEACLGPAPDENCFTAKETSRLIGGLGITDVRQRPARPVVMHPAFHKMIGVGLEDGSVRQRSRNPRQRGFLFRAAINFAHHAILLGFGLRRPPANRRGAQNLRRRDDPCADDAVLPRVVHVGGEHHAAMCADGLRQFLIGQRVHPRFREDHVEHDQTRAVGAEVIEQLRMKPTIPGLPVRLLQLPVRNLVQLHQHNVFRPAGFSKNEREIVTEMGQGLPERQPAQLPAEPGHENAAECGLHVFMPDDGA